MDIKRDVINELYFYTKHDLPPSALKAWAETLSTEEQVKITAHFEKMFVVLRKCHGSLQLIPLRYSERQREAEERAKGKHSDLCIGGDRGPCNCGAVKREWSLLEK